MNFLASPLSLAVLLALQQVQMRTATVAEASPATGQLTRTSQSQAPFVTINYNMVCTLFPHLRRETIPPTSRTSVGSTKRLLPRAAAAETATATVTINSQSETAPKLVEFKVLLNNQSLGVTQVDLYIHPRFEGTRYQAAIEPAPLALEVSKFGQCEDYNHFRMEPICGKFEGLALSEKRKLRPYATQCRQQPHSSSIVDSIYAMHHPRLNRYLCASKNGTVYASTVLNADCFFIMRQLSDSADDRSGSGIPTCDVSTSRRFLGGSLAHQVRASDYYLLISAAYPKPVDDSNARCTLRKMDVTFGKSRRWMIGVSFSGTGVIKQKTVASNTLWKFDTIAPGPDRHLPIIQRSNTTAAATATNTTNRSTEAPSTNAPAGAGSRQDRSRGRKLEGLEGRKWHKYYNQALLEAMKHGKGSFFDHLLANATLVDEASARKVDEDIRAAALNRTRKPPARTPRMPPGRQLSSNDA